MLLAPNGKPSNLIAEQYKLVRTPEFKEWFGDWENDPKNASKVVDENGEPLVCYHFTFREFNVFENVWYRNALDGFFFTRYKNDKEFSRNAPYTTKQYFLNIKKLSIISDISKFKWSIPKYENEWIAEAKKSKGEQAAKSWDLSVFNLIPNSDGIKLMRDGDNKEIIVAFEPNQIKLADGTNTTFDANNPDIRYAKGGKIKTALKDVESAGSVKYWMQPEFPAETYDYEQKGKPNSFVKVYEEKYDADTILAYDKKGNLVGLFGMAKGGDEKGAFKIVVREDSESKGWGKKLLDEAEKQGIDIVGNIKNNKFSHSGRYLLRSWLSKKMEQGGALEFYERTYADGTKQKFTIEEYAVIEKNRELAKGGEMASKYEMGGIFHGTPHKFDKFSTDKMGTGEGGQAFGWGLYYTDVEKIGEHYAKAISNSKSIAESIAQYVYGNGYTKEQSDALIKMPVEEQIKLVNDAYNKKVERINLKEEGDFKNHLLETQNSIRERFISEAKQVTPYLYEVTLFKGKKPEQYTWLEWYEPISEGILSKVISALKNEGKATNSEIERMKINTNAEGVDLYNFCVNVYGSPKEASLFLLRAGIDGVKYDAHNSKGYNYVVFDDNNVTIDKVKELKKGGELAKGINAEMEHKGTIDKFKRAGVSDKDVATSIAKDHLKEDSKYYTKLMEIENKLALGGALLKRKMANGGNIKIQPIREMGTGAKVYFETPFYRVNDNTKDKYILLVGTLDKGGYMYQYTYQFSNLEMPLFVAKELEKIYPNGVPDAVNIGKVVDTLEKKWVGEEEIENDADADIEILEEQPHHGISINVGDYKNPYEVNRAIEKLLNEKGSEQESYTPDEINFLSYYSGYGGLEKQGTFSQDELKGLLYEFFTPDEVVQKMWGLAYKYGYGSIGDNSVFEPSVGVGAFLKYAPDNVFVAANEINRYSAMICRILYPNVRTTLMPFERNFILRNMSVKKNIESLKKYSLVIGNPPYGKLGGIYLPMGEDKYSGASNWAEYFLFRGIDLLHKGGLLIYIIGAEQYNGGNLFLDSALTTTKKAIFEKADLIDAYRLPTKIFERTGVSSEIVIFRKR